MDIGAKLREARESKGMTLEDVQQRTKIQKRYLKAIEENNHSVMPGEFYTRAFIKEYAQTVGLNPDEVLEPKQEQQQEVTAAAPVQGENEAPSRQERSRVRENDRPPRKERKGIPYLSSIIIGLIVLAAIIVVVFLYAGGSNDNNGNNSANQQQNEDQVTDSNQSAEQESDADSAEQSADSEEQANDAAEEEQAKQEEEQAEEPKLSVDEEGTASNPVTTYTLENAGDEVTLKLSAEDGDAWLQVGDGNNAGNVYTGTIASGSEPVEQDVSDLETVSVKTGFARATKLEINGQELTFPIDNDVQTITVNIKK
ncbi:helix-turn-helix domain-containing protein [Terribacillus saccharophilus]|uniref:helix-turn-helix domain-containing protein n=1 Tax=Terribacillus saccharophilus TaxID=361277 RepID=UPI003982AF73